MKKISYPYYVLICIALGLLFIVSCGNSDYAGYNSGGERLSMVDLGGKTAEESQLTAFDADQSEPAIAYDELNDRFLAVWTDSRFLAINGTGIYGALFEASDGTIISNSLVISDGLGDQSQAKVAFDDQSDRFLVVFTDFASGVANISGQFVDGAGAGTLDAGGNFPISPIESYVERYVPYDSGITYDLTAVHSTIEYGTGAKTIFSNTLVPAAASPVRIQEGTTSWVNISYPNFSSLSIYEDDTKVGWYDNGVIVGSRSGINAIENTVAGNGVSTSLNINLTNTPVASGSLYISIVGSADQPTQDDGEEGFIVESPSWIDAANSTVDYETGEIKVSYITAITSDPTGLYTNGTNGPYAFSISNAPIVEGTIKIYSNGILNASDSGLGAFLVTGTVQAGGTIDYTTGAITGLTFTDVPIPGEQFLIDYVRAAPTAADIVQASFNTSDALGLFDSSSTSLIGKNLTLVYNSSVLGAAPAAGVDVIANFTSSTNAQGYDNYSYTSEAKTSPDVVYNRRKDTFQVVWLENSSKDAQFNVVNTDQVCSYDWTDATAYNYSTSPTSLDVGDDNFFKWTIQDGTYVDTNIVRYRDVYYDDAATVDGAYRATAVTYDYSDDILVDTTGDGVADDINKDGIVDTDGSVIDSIVYDASGSKTVSDVEEYSCTAFAESYSRTFSTKTHIYESAPSITFNPLDGTPIVMWAGMEIEVDNEFDYSRSLDPAVNVWTGWSLLHTTPDKAPTDRQRVTFTRLDAGNIWYNQAIEIDGNETDSFPVVAVDTIKNRMLIAWESQATGTDNKDVYGQLYSLDNYIPYGLVIDISTEQFAQTTPSVSFDVVNQRYMAVWEDARNETANLTNMDVYGQFIDPQGQRSGGNFAVSIADKNQMGPSVAFGDFEESKFFIPWKDARDPGDAEIYGQFWQFSEAPQLEITDVDGMVIYNDTLAWQAVPINDVPVLKKFRIHNNGNAVLIINGITSGADVSLTADAAIPFNMTTAVPSSINPGYYYEMVVSFAPTLAVTYGVPDSIITIKSNGGSDKVFNFTGSGIGDNPYISTEALPDGALNETYTTILEVAEGTAPYTWAEHIANVPDGLTLDINTGEVGGTPTTAGSYTFTIKVTDASSTVAYKEFTIVIENMVISTASLQDAIRDSSYTNSLSPSGGTSPYTWAIMNDSAPAGLSLVANVLSGTPTAEGPYNVIIQLTDSAAATYTKALELTVIVIPDVTITTISADLALGQVSVYYDQTLDRNLAADEPASFVINGGVAGSALPSGLTLGKNTGRITGTPTEDGTFAFSVLMSYTDPSDNEVYYDEARLSIVIAAESSSSSSDDEVTTTTACFIATAAYGSYLDPHVMALREFRDKYMLTNDPGRALVNFYYRHSPPIAEFIADVPVLKSATRLALTPIVFAVEYPLIGFVIVLLAGGVVTSTRRRRR
jgi:hypothetical protein